MPTTTTKVVAINHSVLSQASQMEQLLVLSFMRDIRSNLLSIEKAKDEIRSILSGYAKEQGKEVFEELMFTNN